MTNSNMSTQFSAVHREIEEIIGSYAWGISMSRLSWLERSYEEKFKRSLDYKSLGVNNIKELIVKLGEKKMVLLIKEPKRKEKFVVSARNVELKKKFLKLNVQELLDENGGEITFSSFDDLYKYQFMVKLKYHRYGLTNLDHLCKVFKDIVVVGANSSGEKVIKAAEKIYNLRKRKRYE